MPTLRLTEKELRALIELIYENPCRSGCCYSENEDKDIDCESCEFTRMKYSLWGKVENLFI